MSARHVGVICAFHAQHGYGFADSGPLRVFVHVADVLDGPQRRLGFAVGDRVEFELDDTPRGPRARRVRLVTPAPQETAHG